MRVGVDATPLLGLRTGIGNYTAHLLAELPRALDPGDEVAAAAFTHRGHRALTDALPPGVTPTGRPLPARVLRRLWMRSDRPDVRLVTGPVDVMHGTNFVLPPARGASGVVTIHDLAYLRWPSTVAAASLDYARLVPRALARGAHVCTPSAAVAEQVRDAYPVPPERVHVTPLGVDDSWASAQPLPPKERRALGVPSSYVLAVGTMEPRKNLALLLDTYRLAARERLDLPPLVLVGGHGWGEQLVTHGVAPDRLVLTGYLPQERLRQVVAGAQALLFPSLDEGFGLPPLEALACGVPALVSDLPVTREVLGLHCAYADPHDVESFLIGMQSVLGTPPGTAASRRAYAARFTWAQCAYATVAAYRAARG
ncbi:MAG: glycosyltransferase family 4 protein [Dermatophilaceae bacterium]